MPGQATVAIRDKQWSVVVANTLAEITTGLSGVESMPSQTGMLFDLGYDHKSIQIDMTRMLFPLDIIFINSTQGVVGVMHDIQPGWTDVRLENEVQPGARCFLEINAGEAEGIEDGDSVNIQGLISQNTGLDLTGLMNFLLVFMVMFMMMRMADRALEPAKERKMLAGAKLPPGYKPVHHSSIHPCDYKELPWYRSFGEVRYAVERGSPEDKETLGLVACLMEESEPSPKRVELVRTIEARLHARGIWTGEPLTESIIQKVGYAEGFLEAAAMELFMPRERIRELFGGGHHSKWLTPEQRKELEKKYGAVTVRWAEEATRPGDIKGVEAAAEYYYEKLREVFGLGHLSPELTEEQIMKLREVLGLPVDVAEVLKIHRKTGYIP